MYGPTLGLSWCLPRPGVDYPGACLGLQALGLYYYYLLLLLSCIRLFIAERLLLLLLPVRWWYVLGDRHKGPPGRLAYARVLCVCCVCACVTA